MFIFSLLSALLSIYTMFCFIRIILTWFPNMRYSKFTNFLATICDPYLNMFSKFRFLRLGYVDFSPVISIGVLVAASSLLNKIALQQRIYVGGLIAALISMIWSIVVSLLGLFTVIMAIRLIALLISKNNSSQIWLTLDSVINPITTKIASFFTNGSNFVSQKKALIISIAIFIILQLVGGLLISFIISFFHNLPF